MHRKPRNSDGTIRNTRRTQKLTARSILARWVEAETLHLKHIGMGFQAIAEHVMRVGRGEQQSMVALPDEALFGERYRISAQAIHRAFKRAIERAPNAEAEQHRKLDTERCETMFLSLQTGIRQGDTKSIEAGVRVLVHKAKINGYVAPSKLEVTGANGAIPITVIQRAVKALDGDE
jgi:hypothetical protein